MANASTLTRTFAACIAAAICAPAAELRNHELLHAVLWTQTAAEHDAICLQTYRSAREQLGRALKNKDWTAATEQISGYKKLPAAVILDIDETVLDNSPMEARTINEDADWTSEAWSAWVGESAARALPGALEFTKYAHSRGVSVFYITNREAKEEAATRRNLERLGFPVELAKGPLSDAILTRSEKPEWGSDKSSRRAEIARYYRVLMLVGDDLGDFLANVRTTPESRAAMLAQHQERWGTRWFMLPNPMYGSWESALLDADARAPRPRKLELKYRRLKTEGERSQ